MWPDPVKLRLARLGVEPPSSLSDTMHSPISRERVSVRRKPGIRAHHEQARNRDSNALCESDEVG